MAENTDINEKDPKHKKKMQLFALGAIGLLCITLILSTFISTGKKRQSEPEPLPIDEPKAPPQDTAKESFEQQMEQARIKHKRANSAGSLSPEEQQARVDQIMNGTAASQQKPVEKEPEKPSIEEEFRKQERKRALMARRSRFGLKGGGRSDDSETSTQTTAGTAGFAPLNNLEAEQARVAKEIAQLEKQLQSPGSPRPAGMTGMFGQNQQTPNASTATPGSSVVGQPATESSPKPGQKLVSTGTVINAVLDQELNSDYTGPFRGMITHDVYDVSGNYIIMPKGTRVTGKALRISNVNEPIQARMGIIVQWTVLPDGKRISFERRGSAMDKAGVGAIKDQVDYHFLAQFLGVAAYAVLASSTTYEGSGYNQDRTFDGDVSQALREQFAPLAEKYLSLVPTITLQIGTPFKVFLEDDIYAYPWSNLGEKLYHASRTVN